MFYLFLATVRNPDVAGVHNEYDFNMQITTENKIANIAEINGLGDRPLYFAFIFNGVSIEETSPCCSPFTAFHLVIIRSISTLRDASSPKILSYGIPFKIITRRRGGGDAGVHHMLRRGAGDEDNAVSA